MNTAEFKIRVFSEDRDRIENKLQVFHQPTLKAALTTVDVGATVRIKEEVYTVLNKHYELGVNNINLLIVDLELLSDPEDYELAVSALSEEDDE